MHAQMMLLGGASWRRGWVVGCSRGLNCQRQQRWTSTQQQPVKPVLRFAPSPTGQLHLGGLRTALFNHLFARRHGGKWILRIEDTDQRRLVPGAVEAMQDVLRWAGLDYDEGPDKPSQGREPSSYIQSSRLALYQSYAQRLLEAGRAYRDFRPPKAVPDDVATRRARSTSSERYLAPDEAEARRLIEAGHEHVARLVRPKRDTNVKDLVYGNLNFPYDELLDDPILVKSDGWPTYHLANVVDDADMGVTHVLRGEEWLPSLPLHLALYEALEITPPHFAHLPLLVNPDGSKLSKRHADVHVESYRARGIEPEALVNFVGLMGFNWHHIADSISSGNTTEVDNGEGQGEGKEVFSMADMIQGFSLDRITHSRATPNMGKLDYLNRQHLSRKLAQGSTTRQHTLQRLQGLMVERWSAVATSQNIELDLDRIGRMADILAHRADSLASLVDEAAIFLEHPDWTSEEAQKTVESLGHDEVAIVLSKCNEILQHADRPASEVMEETLSELAKMLEEEQGLKEEAGRIEGEKKQKKKKKKSGKARLMRPLRLALMGGQPGPTVVEALSVLGKSASSARIEACMEALSLKK